MSILNTRTQYGWLNIALHWITVLAIYVLFTVGLWIEELDYYDPLYKLVPHLHKSFGVLLVVLVVCRLILRETNAKPGPLPHHKRWEIVAARITHYTLYGLIFLMFPTGYLITTAKGQGLDVFNFLTIPALITDVDNLEDIAGTIHYLIACSIIILSFMHALGALKHHFKDKDETLKRMLFSRH